MPKCNQVTKPPKCQNGTLSRALEVDVPELLLPEEQMVECDKCPYHHHIQAECKNVPTENTTTRR